ncbi:ACT domain-containing protein ACR1 [Heracleum sosnowskyi]|uniref:ACT domain-containing protein ACR n=1 Tax=Heracleum sosnowskyi TaxID=360622 RepID=A0AAD8MSE2_9APIA|nr:ACT domain-containing protein ACR1 [Heracleum sosnowskyi]
MDITYSYRPYFDPEFDSLIERIHPPRVCIDNDTCQDCTLIKVDSANRQGILLELVQVMTDLELVISKSYISSDGGWFMDVFHVTDQLGNKITDESLINYVQQLILQAMSARSRKTKTEVQPGIGRIARPRHISIDQTALEMTVKDRPGVMSEISAVLAELGCQVSAAVAWTHNDRAACIIYVEDESNGSPITDPCRVAHIQAHLENVVEAHHYTGERRSLKLAVPTTSRTHTERRLHQLMANDKDYEEVYERCRAESESEGAKVTIDNCAEKGYSIITVRCRDRPKLLFDTVCALTDMQYVVFHASISSHRSIAVQEYYVRQEDGCTLNTEEERLIVIKCLTAAVERRVSNGLRLDVSTQDRAGLLSDVTRVFRENGLSIVRAELGTCNERAVGSFYVKDTSGYYVNSDTVEAVRREIGGTNSVVNISTDCSIPRTSEMTSTSWTVNTSMHGPKGSNVEDRSRFSLGDLLWSQIERLSSNFRPIK